MFVKPCDHQRKSQLHHMGEDVQLQDLSWKLTDGVTGYPFGEFETRSCLHNLLNVEVRWKWFKDCTRTLNHSDAVKMVCMACMVGGVSSSMLGWRGSESKQARPVSESSRYITRQSEYYQMHLLYFMGNATEVEEVRGVETHLADGEDQAAKDGMSRRQGSGCQLEDCRRLDGRKSGGLKS